MATVPRLRHAGDSQRGVAHRRHRRRAAGHTARSARGRYGNPADLRRFLRRQLASTRDAWQRPAAVVRALGLERGDVVAEIGSGPGYFTPRLARAVGPSGHVYAVDPEPAVLEVLRRRLTRARVRNVTPVLGSGSDPLLPAGGCALALIVNAYHHFADGPAFLRRVGAALAPGGRVVNIDWHRRETPMGPPAEHRVGRDDFLRDARRAGLEPVAEHRFLPHQYFLVLAPRPNRRRRNPRRQPD